MQKVKIRRTFEQKVLSYIASRLGVNPRNVQVNLRPLRGGLDLAEVNHVAVRAQVDGRQERFGLVVKRLTLEQSREAEVYERLRTVEDVSPRLFGIDREPDEVRLYLEYVRAEKRWPWRDVALSAEVIRRLVQVHSHLTAAAADDPVLQSWDYEAELKMAGKKLLMLMENPRAQQLSCVRKALPSARLLVRDMTRIRRELLGQRPFGGFIIHGDAHTGNVVVRRRHGALAPLLLDWGRVRAGSTLEDVSSWLQSLGYWEPQVKKSHDRLLSLFLSESGHEGGLSRDLLDVYWLAAASTVIAGAAEYNIAQATFAPHLPKHARDASAAVAADSLRVVQQAGACWG